MTEQDRPPHLETLAALAHAAQERLAAEHAHVRRLEWLISVLIAVAAALSAFGASPNSNVIGQAARVASLITSIGLLVTLLYSRKHVPRMIPLTRPAYDQWVNEAPEAVMHVLNGLRLNAARRLSELAYELTAVVHVGLFAVLVMAAIILADTILA